MAKSGPAHLYFPHVSSHLNIIKKYLPVSLAFLSCFVIVLTSFFVLFSKEEKAFQDRVAYEGHNRIEVIKQQIATSMQSMQAIRAYYDGSEKVERGEFQVFIRNFQKGQKNPQTFEWIPRVAKDRREAFELEVQQEGFSQFQISERDEHGTMIRAGERQEYFPIAYIEPYRGNEIALGYDEASDKMRFEAMEKACDNAAMIGTARIVLVQSQKPEYALRVFMPVYRKGADINTVESRRQNLEGFISTAFEIGTIAEEALEKLTPSGLDFFIFDNTAPVGQRFLYSHLSRLRMSGPTVHVISENELGHLAGVYHSGIIAVAGRQWQFVFVPTPRFIIARHTLLPYLALILFLVIILWIVFYLLQRIRDAERFEKEVQARTSELTFVNLNLEREIAERKKMEESERRLAVIVESSNDAIISTDLEGTILSWNKGAESILGYGAHEMIGKSISIIGPENVKEPPRVIIERLKQEETMKYYETQRKRKDGIAIDVELTVSPIKNSNGVLIGVSGILRNISERKRAQEELKWKTAFLEAQIESSLDGILVVDEKGQRVINNQRFLTIMKVPHDSVIHQKNDEALLQHAVGLVKYPDQFLEKVKYLYAHPQETSRDEIEFKDGMVLDRYSSPVLDTEGNYYGRIWIFRDITERKRHEVKMQRTLTDLTQFKRVTIDRENRMIELKKEINRLSQELGRKPPY